MILIKWKNMMKKHNEKNKKKTDEHEKNMIKKNNKQKNEK